MDQDYKARAEAAEAAIGALHVALQAMQRHYIVSHGGADPFGSAESQALAAEFASSH